MSEDVFEKWVKTGRASQLEIDAFRAEIERLRKGSERYQWLRHGDNDERVIQHGPIEHDYHWLPRNERLDDMIDAAMKEPK